MLRRMQGWRYWGQSIFVALQLVMNMLFEKLLLNLLGIDVKLVDG